MSTSPAKTLSPSELAKLEHAFATDPASDAYRPLAEAYLGMGRFMEAMVVCKKGVKAHPNRPDPRLLLARVYAEQGKDKKALEELTSALGVAPNDKSVLRMTGALQMKTGETEPGKANLLKAYEVDPVDPETLAAMQQFKVEPPKKAPPPAPEPPTERVPTLQQNGVPSRVTGQRAAVNGTPSASNPGVPRVTGQRAAVRPAYEETYFEESISRATKPSQSRAIFFAVGPVLLLFLVGYLAWGQYNGKRQREFKHHLSEVQRALDEDSFASYKRACSEADEALQVDSSSALGQGYAAYAWTVRWGEHGGGEEAHRNAEEHLAAGKKIGEPDAHLYAADALLKLYSGKVTQAQTDLEAQVKQLDAQGKASPLLYSTLALIQMNAGDLEKALDSATHAQQLAPSEPRIYAIEGNIYRRRGEDKQAKDAFNAGLKYNSHHPECQLGRAIIWSSGDDPRGYTPAASVLATFIDSEPPPSPRQLAVAHMTRTLLISRLVNAAQSLRPEQQRALADATKLPSDPAAGRSAIKADDDAAVALDSGNPELHLIRGRRYEIEGKYDEAANEVRSAIATDPSRALYYVELAAILLHKPEGAKEAGEALNQAIRTVGESPRLMYMLGQVYRKENLPDDAMRQFRRAVEGKSKNPDARLAMTEIDFEKKDFANAEIEATKAVQDLLGSPGEKIAQAYVLRARIYEAKDDKVKAKKDYENALNQGPDYAPAYFYYARFLAAAGDPDSKARSRKTAEEYLTRDPNGPFAQEAQGLTR